MCTPYISILFFGKFYVLWIFEEHTTIFLSKTMNVTLLFPKHFDWFQTYYSKMEDPKSPQLSTSEAKNSSLDSDCSEDEEEVKSQTYLQEPPKPKQKRVKRPPDPTDPVVIAAAAAAASAAAEAEEAARLEAEKASKMSSLENLKYYTSLFLGTLCIVNVFAFLFLVPFVLDPAISTLRHK